MKVEIWSDVVCPWCYIGKRRFEAALAAFPQRSAVELVWRSFELDPHAVPSTEVQGDYGDRLAAKYGRGRAQAQEMLDTMTATAAQEGLDFRFDLATGGNTFDAHRLLHLALERGLQDPLKERLDAATFGQGLSVSDHDALTSPAPPGAATATPTPSGPTSSRRRPTASAECRSSSSAGSTACRARSPRRCCCRR
jgi:predicted DsbA family dithiol-disulfide isomerase